MAKCDGPAAASKCSSQPDIVALVHEHHAVVYRYAFRLTGSAADAEDLAQQAFLLAQQRLSQLRDVARAGGWLLAIVRNCFLKDKRRKRVVEPLVEEPIEPEDHEFPDWVDPEQLQQALNRLPDEARAILVLFFFEDCSYKEIAESLEVPLGTVMSRLSRAKAKLKRELSLTAECAARKT
jgi:RNA polymerase sigma-70 factor, ECF subfamily